jgi:deoxyribonuclease-4
MKIGAHVSASGGVNKAFERAKEIGANCFQIFVSSPRMWKVGEIEGKDCKLFKQNLKDYDMSPSFVHIKYLCNLSSPNPETIEKSVVALAAEFGLTGQLGLTGAMFHIGSLVGSDRARGIEKVVNGIKKVLDKTPEGNAKLLLENSASSNKIGAKFEEIAEIIQKVGSNRIGVCLDTAHAFVAGYELRDQPGVDAFVQEIENTFGLDRLCVIHANDSKADFGSSRDLHENIGKGKIGSAGFAALLNHPKLKKIPFILEVPGYDKNGPDKPNINALRKLVK